MTILEKIIEEYPDAEFIKADGYDDAIIGVDTDSLRLIYDSGKVIESLIEDFREGVTGEDEDELAISAQEFFDFNIAGAKGEGFPIWAQVFSKDES